MGTKHKMQKNNRPKPEIVGKSLESAEILVRAWILSLSFNFRENLQGNQGF